MSKELIETLDALSNERPVVLQLKKRHFNIEDKLTGTRRESLEWMRINTEKERVARFKSIVAESASQYYIILQVFAKMLEERKVSSLGEMFTAVEP